MPPTGPARGVSTRAEKSPRFVLSAGPGMLSAPLDSSSMSDPTQLEQLKSCDGSAFRELYAIYASSIVAREQKPQEWICAMVQAPEYHVWVSKAAGHVQG